MDFKSFTAKITDLSSKAVSASVEALAKTTDFTYENLKKTPVMLKVPADFETVRMEKRLVIFCLGKDDPVSKNIVLQLPILFSKAWIESASLKTIAAEDSPDLVKILEVATPGVLIYREGELKASLKDTAQITEFVASFDIRKDWNASTSEVAPTTVPAKPTEAPVDPLASQL